MMWRRMGWWLCVVVVCAANSTLLGCVERDPTSASNPGGGDGSRGGGSGVERGHNPAGPLPTPPLTKSIGEGELGPDPAQAGSGTPNTTADLGATRTAASDAGPVDAGSSRTR